MVIYGLIDNINKIKKQMKLVEKWLENLTRHIMVKQQKEDL